MPFHFWYAVISIQLQVGPFIIWLVIGGVSCIEYKWGYVVGSYNMCFPIIKLVGMDIKEEYLGVDLAISKGSTEYTCCLHPSIPVHISWRRVVYQPVTEEVPVKILGFIFCLVNNHRCHESLAISSGEYQSITPEGLSLSCLVFPNSFPHEELVCTDNSETWSIWIEANLITIPNLGWTRLDFFEFFGYCFQVNEVKQCK